MIKTVTDGLSAITEKTLEGYTAFRAGYMNMYVKDDEFKHTRPFPPGLIASYALASVLPKGIKPRETHTATLIFDETKLERDQRNSDPLAFPYASKQLIDLHERILIIGLHLLFGPKVVCPNLLYISPISHTIATFQNSLDSELPKTYQNQQLLLTNSLNKNETSTNNSSITTSSTTTTATTTTIPNTDISKDSRPTSRRERKNQNIKNSSDKITTTEKITTDSSKVENIQDELSTNSVNEPEKLPNPEDKSPSENKKTKIENPRITLCKITIIGLEKEAETYENTDSNGKIVAKSIRKIVSILDNFLKGELLPKIPGDQINIDVFAMCQEIVSDVDIVKIITNIRKTEASNNKSDINCSESIQTRTETFEIIENWGRIYKKFMDKRSVL